MYTNCRANSLLDWKIIIDQDAEDYLLQSIIRKTEWKNGEGTEHEPGGGRIAHTTKMTRNTEEERKYNAAENKRPTHRVAPDNPRTSVGRTNMNNLSDLREAMKTGLNQMRKKRDSKSEEETKTPRNNEGGKKIPSKEHKNSEKQPKRKPTRKVIIEMVREGYLTEEEGQDQLEEWGLNRSRHTKPQ